MAAGIFNGPYRRQYTFSIPLLAKMLEEEYPLDFVFDKARRDHLATEALRPESAL